MSLKLKDNQQLAATVRLKAFIITFSHTQKKNKKKNTQHKKRDEYFKILEKILKNYGIARNKPADCQ